MKLIQIFSKDPMGRAIQQFNLHALWVCERGHAVVENVRREELPNYEDSPPQSCDVCELLGRFETKVTQELSTEPVGPAVEQVAGEVLASLPGPDYILDQDLGRDGIVHELHHGIATCGLRGPPRNWPAGHRWASRERFRNDGEWPDNPGDRRCSRCLASSVTDGQAQR